jgi:hypothetical protein
MGEFVVCSVCDEWRKCNGRAKVSWRRAELAECVRGLLFPSIRTNCFSFRLLFIDELTNSKSVRTLPISSFSLPPPLEFVDSPTGLICVYVSNTIAAAAGSKDRRASNVRVSVAIGDVVRGVGMKCGTWTTVFVVVTRMEME